MGQNGYTMTTREKRSAMKCTALGIDLAKQVYTSTVLISMDGSSFGSA
jgi:hypothetical protein